MRFAAAAVLVLALASVAHADPPGLTPATPMPVDAADTGSYRLQTAGVDAATLLLGVVAAKDNSDAALGAAIGTYFVGPALVHLYHHHPGRAAASIALRVGLPFVLGAIGNSLGKSQCSYECDNDADIAFTAWGVLAGGIAASAIDIGYLSRGEDRAAPAALLPPPPPPSQPLATHEPHEMKVSLAFAF